MVKVARKREVLKERVVSPRKTTAGRVQNERDTHPLPDRSVVVATVQDRCIALRSTVKLINRVNNQMWALATRHLMSEREVTWQGLDEKERDKLCKSAISLVKELEQEKHVDVPPYLIDSVMVTRKFLESQGKYRKLLERKIVVEVKKLHIRSWIEHPDQRGVNYLIIGQIIGETGDLSNYATVSRVWKRMGLAVINGKRQGCPGKDATVEDWLEHGYCPRRRSVAWKLGNYAIVTSHKKGAYYAYYLKVKEKAKADENKADWTKGHVHNHARRLLSKHILKHLWCSWNNVEAFPE